MSLKQIITPKIIIATMAVVIGSFVGGILLFFVTDRFQDRSALPLVTESVQQVTQPSSVEDKTSASFVGEDVIRKNAQAYLGGAAIKEMELEKEDIVSLYKVKLTDERELFFNANTGAFVGEDQEKAKHPTE